jgi:DNA-binding GntR family transcriptional regulator
MRTDDLGEGTTTGTPRILGSMGNSSSLRTRVTDVLREALIVGELEPGVVYSAPALAQRLAVSATPVREAMMELASEGLVEVLRHRGYRVLELSDKTLTDITELRELIEVPASERAATTASADDVAELRKLASTLNTCAAAGELREFIAADTQFHLKLLSLSGNEVLVDEVRRLRGMTRLYGLRDLYASGHLLETAQEHHDIVDAVEARDPHAVRKLVTQHLGHIRGVWSGRAEDAASSELS